MQRWLRLVLPRRVLCPYCFRRFRMSRAPFRCTNVACSSKRPVDPVLEKNWQAAAPRQKGVVLDPAGRARRRECPDCKLETGVRICPECHIRLPREFDRSDNAIIAIVGAKDAGKSHFIASAIHELKNRVSSEMEFALEPMDDETMDRYREYYEQPLYRNHEQLSITTSGLTNANVRLPMLFSLKLRGKNLVGRSKIARSITLAFFDTAGEDLRRRDNMNSVTRYVAEACGIIMLLDPTQMDSVRARLPAPPSPAAPGTDQADLLTRVCDLVRDLRGLRESAVIPIPIAVALSKFDQLHPIVPDAGMSVLGAIRHGRLYDAVAARTVIDEVESLLQSWRCDGLLEQVRTNFREHGFFGVSSTGCNVDPATGRFPFVKPGRVEDPFLWLLYRIGFLKAADARAAAKVGS